MNLQSLHAYLAAQEIFLATMASLILVIGLYWPKESRTDVCYWLSIGTLVATTVIIAQGFGSPPGTAFNGLYVDDRFGDLIKMGMCLLSAAVFIYGRDYHGCLLYTSPSPRDATLSRMPSSA